MSTNPWHSTVPLSQAIVQALIEQQFPLLCPVTNVTYIDQGFDNTVYLINNQIIFRFPRRPDAVTVLLCEYNALSHLQKRFELRIPDPVYIGKTSSLFPYPFHGYRMLPGISGCYAKLSATQRAASIIPLAHFLHTLHAIPKKEIDSWSIQAPVYDRTNWALAAPKLRTRIAYLQKNSTIRIDDTAIEHEIAHAGLLKLSNHQVLVHNDLYAKHMLFVDGTLSGIIDWGDSCIGHPAADLAVIHGFYPATCHEAFLQTYGLVDQSIWEYARFLAIYYACTLAWYAHEQKDAALLDECITSLERLGIAVSLD